MLVGTMDCSCLVDIVMGMIVYIHIQQLCNNIGKTMIKGKSWPSRQSMLSMLWGSQRTCSQHFGVELGLAEWMRFEYVIEGERA
jgi:hypothetical protein